jgi:hypothetical protein
VSNIALTKLSVQVSTTHTISNEDGGGRVYLIFSYFFIDFFKFWSIEERKEFFLTIGKKGESFSGQFFLDFWATPELRGQRLIATAKIQGSSVKDLCLLNF